MNKFSSKATLAMLLQGMLRGIDRAKSDPFVQDKYPRGGLDFIEKMVKDLLAKAKNNPNFTLTEKQVKKLNQFLKGSSGVLSPILRRYIVQHCKGNQCTMVGQNDFKFEYVPPKYKVTGVVSKTDHDGNLVQSATIDETVERLSEVLRKYIPFFQGFPQRGAVTDIEVVGNKIKMTSIYRPNPNDVFDAYTQYATMQLYVNGNELPRQLAQKVVEYYSKHS